MKCYKCGSETHQMRVDVPVSVAGGKTLVIKAVPAHVCDCGERYFDQSTLMAMLRLKQDYMIGQRMVESDPPPTLLQREVAYA